MVHNDHCGVRKAKHTSSRVIVITTLLGVAVAVATIALAGMAINSWADPFDDASFNAAVWKASGSASIQRAKMARAATHELRSGMTVQQITGLLGKYDQATDVRKESGQQTSKGRPAAWIYDYSLGRGPGLELTRII